MSELASRITAGQRVRGYLRHPDLGIRCAAGLVSTYFAALALAGAVAEVRRCLDEAVACRSELDARLRAELDETDPSPPRGREPLPEGVGLEVIDGGAELDDDAAALPDETEAPALAVAQEA